MANEPTKEDMDKLEAKIKEITKRSDALHAAVDETHKAAEAVKSVAATRTKELGNIKQRK